MRSRYFTEASLPRPVASTDLPVYTSGRLRMTEVFYSVQGEGGQVGLPTVFLRLTGCSLRCSWCDTAYSFTGGQDRDVDDVVAEAERFPVRRACVTGGEPLDQKAECEALVARLLQHGWEVVVETSGAVDVGGLDALPHRERLCISMDVKCPSSNMQKRNLWANLAVLRPQDQLKFVIADEEDYAYAKEVLAKHPGLRAPVVLNPMTVPPPDHPKGLRVGRPVDLKWVAERVLADGLDARVGIQMHKLIWGNEKGR